jgi:hypothetical protein
VDGRYLVPIGSPAGPPAPRPSPAGLPATPGLVPATPGSAGGLSKRLRGLYSELGAAASLGFLAWPAILFLAPASLQFTLFDSPALVGAFVGALLLLGKLVSRRSLGLGDLILGIVDGIVATLVFAVAWELL